MDNIEKFINSYRTGTYYAVIKEGELKAGDEIKLLSKDIKDVSINDIVRLYIINNTDNSKLHLMKRAIELEFLPEGWRKYLARGLIMIRHKNDLETDTLRMT